MNTALVVDTGFRLDELRTDLSYMEVFPKGILGAGSEILSNPDMRTMARGTIFMLGAYQNRSDFVLNDLYRELEVFDIRNKFISGDTEEIEAMLADDQVHILRRIVGDLEEDTLSQDCSWGELYSIYKELNKNVDMALQAESVYSVCRLALELNYRIIIEDSDLTSFSPGVFRDMFKEGSPAYDKTIAILAAGLAYKVILNDSQVTLPQSEPITRDIRQAFPEAKTVTLRVLQGRY